MSAMLLLLVAQAAAAATLAERFGARPGIEHASLAPDGRHIAYVVPVGGQGSAILVQPTSEGAGARPVVQVKGDPDRLGGCGWVSDERLVCSLYGVVRRPVGVAFELLDYTRLAALDTSGGNQRLLERPRNDRTRGLTTDGGTIIDWLPDESDAVLMSRYVLPDDATGSRIGSAAEGLGVERVDTATLRTRRVEPPRADAADYITDGRGNVRLMALRPLKGQTGNLSPIVTWMYRPAGSREWQRLGTWDSSTREGFRPRAVDPDRNVAIGFRKLNGFDALIAKALDGTGTETPLVVRDDVDVDGLVRIGRRGRVVGGSFATDRRVAIYFDDDIARLRVALEKALPEGTQVSILDASADERKLLVWAGRDDDAGVHYLLDRDTSEMRTLVVSRPELEGLTLAKVEAIQYRAADGTMVPAYLTLPPGGPRKGLPAIVLPHGGPSARDEWGFDWLSQFYAASGYAVIQPNFRGSAGYGEAWLQQNGFRSWGIAISDVLDAGRHLVREGIADPAKLGVVGWSYGGYAALQSAVVDPSLFRAVVAIAPVTDFEMLREEFRNFTSYRLRADQIGSGPHIREGSPAQNAERIKAPVLMFHGALDRNVGVRQSELMAQRLARAGTPARLVKWDHLDHYLEDSRARTQLLAESDSFLKAAFAQ